MRELITKHRWAVVAAVVVATLVLVACSSGSSLTGKTWQWVSWTTVTPTVAVGCAGPVRLHDRVRLGWDTQAKADCNTVAGTYTSSASGGLKIPPDPSTLAACGADSLSGIFVEKLGLAIGYTFFRSEMTINLQDLGTMQLK